jgi:thiamine-phosphate pyrophosphorylase
VLDPTLYLVTDTALARPRPVADVVRAAVAGGVTVVQVRDKTASRRELLALTRAVQAAVPPSVPVVVNDAVDVALLAGADGVHVGQDDVPLSEVRRLPGALRVGVSTHDFAQLAAALAERPDYVALGPIFPTRSKLRADPALGVEAVRDAARLAREAGVPLVLIGGLTLSVAPELAHHDVCAAVISDLFASGTTTASIAARARAWQAALAPV